MMFRSDVKQLKELQEDGFALAEDGIKCEELNDFYDRVAYEYPNGDRIMEIRCNGGNCHVFAIRFNDGQTRLATPQELLVLSS